MNPEPWTPSLAASPWGAWQRRRQQMCTGTVYADSQRRRRRRGRCLPSANELL